MKFTSEQILQSFKTKGYEIKSLPYQMNIFGVRNSNSQANSFDDLVGIIYRDEKGNWQIRQYSATTDPGTYYREKPMNVNGTAMIVPMQHKNCYKLGTHKDYKAIQQCGKIRYVRDNDKNKLLNFAYKILGYKYYEEIGATNIHRSSSTGTSGTVDNWSAGCQVFANIKDFNEFIALIESSINNYKFVNLFDYTLFESEDIK